MYFDDKEYLFMDDSVSVHNGHATENCKNENEIKPHPAGEESLMLNVAEYISFFFKRKQRRRNDRFCARDPEGNGLYIN